MMTIVSHIALQPGSEPAWDDAFRERAAAAREQRGFVAVQLCIPLDAPNERVVIGTWETRADWEGWHETEPFRRTRQQMEEAETETRHEWWHEVVLEERRP